jgi:hypothetical protein
MISVEDLQPFASLNLNNRLEVLDCQGASSLLDNRCSHMYRDKSSTSRRKYLLPPGVAGDNGQHKSLWTRSSILLARYRACVGKDACLCFPTKHPSQT